jgi:hypothetical protein
MSAHTEQLNATAVRRVRERLYDITGLTLAEVRITRVRWPEGLRWVAMTLAAHPTAARKHREIPITEAGQHKTIALLLRDAFPHANWSRAQDYDVTTGLLREHTPRVPDCLMSDAL